MKQTLRRFTSLLCVLLCLCGLAACSQSGSPAQQLPGLGPVTS